MFVRKNQTIVKTHSLRVTRTSFCKWQCLIRRGAEQQQLDARSNDCIALLARQKAPEVPFGNLANFSLC